MPSVGPCAGEIKLSLVEELDSKQLLSSVLITLIEGYTRGHSHRGEKKPFQDWLCGGGGVREDLT